MTSVGSSRHMNVVECDRRRTGTLPRVLLETTAMRLRVCSSLSLSLSLALARARTSPRNTPAHVSVFLSISFTRQILTAYRPSHSAPPLSSRIGPSFSFTHARCRCARVVPVSRVSSLMCSPRMLTSLVRSIRVNDDLARRRIP